MTSIFDKFDEAFDTDELKKDLEKAAENGGEYEDVPVGDYVVKIDQIELRETKNSGKPMVSIWFKIVEGKYKNQRLFYNQVIASGFGLHMANDFLKSLDTDVDVEFESFHQYNDMLLDIAEAAEQFEYHVKYSQNSKGYSEYKVVEVFEI